MYPERRGDSQGRGDSQLREREVERRVGNTAEECARAALELLKARAEEPD